MKNLFIRSILMCSCILIFAFATNAQKIKGDAEGSARAAGSSLMKDTGSAAVVFVGSAAKAGWWTTKFAAGHVAKPIVVKAAPAAGKYALKKSAKYLLPLAIKLSIL